MQANEFEKQMQQKMEELRLNPSSAVWENIELKIKKEKQRKRVFIFLPLLLICFLITGYFIWHTSTLTKNDHQPIENSLTKESVLNKSIGKLNTAQNITNEKEPINLLTPAKKLANRNILSKKINLQLHKNSVFRSIIRPKSTMIINEVKATDIAGNESKENLSEINSVFEKINTDEEGKTGKGVPVLDSSLEKAVNHIIVAQVKDQSALDKETGNTNKKNKIKNNWDWGFTLSGGISNVIADNKKINPQAYPQDYNNIPATGGSFIPKTPPRIKSSGGLSAGFFIKKSITKTFILSTGLEYKFFSTIGNNIKDSSNYQSRNFISNHYNYFHFIDLPIELQTKINRLKRLPLYFNSGISISRYLSGNAYQFNYVTGSYYKGDLFFNKTQLKLSGGLSVLLFSTQKNPITIGPFVQYGITKISKKGVYTNAHFMYTGLKTQIMFGKK